MDILRLSLWLRDIVPKLVVVDGYVFIDRFDRGAKEIEADVSKYSSVKEAQSWVNIVLLDDFITEVVGDDWEKDDEGIDELLSIYEEAWRLQLRLLFPGQSFKIERRADDEYDDLGLILIQESKI